MGTLLGLTITLHYCFFAQTYSNRKTTEGIFWQRELRKTDTAREVCVGMAAQIDVARSLIVPLTNNNGPLSPQTRPSSHCRILCIAKKDVPLVLQARWAQFPCAHKSYALTMDGFDIALQPRSNWSCCGNSTSTCRNWKSFLKFYPPSFAVSCPIWTNDSSGRLTSGKGTPPGPSVCGRWSDLIIYLQWSVAIWPATNVCRLVAHERPRSEIVNKVTHTLTCTHARRCPFPWQLKVADVRLMFCLLPVVLIAAQTIVDEASSSVFRKQNATQLATQRSPWTRFASRTLLSVYSHILTWFWAVLFTTRVSSAGRLLVACIGAL